jgi:hypothetical protein
MPVLHKLISTWKKVPLLAEYNMYLSRFDCLMKLSYNHGNQYLSDRDFIDQGFCADIDAYGNEKIRDATISQENQKRAKCLASIAEVATQAKQLEEIDYKLQRKELLKQSEDHQNCCEDQELVTKLCALAGIKALEDNVGKCKLVHFDKLKAAELKAFIIACHPKFMKISDVTHLKNPRGGKLIEEANCGVDNCISVEYRVYI